jgi:hypothetical protein
VDQKSHINNTNEALLTLDDKGISTAKGVLSMIFRKILADINLNPTTWSKLMKAYLDDPRNRVPQGSRARSSTRGNLNKELSKPKMTWQNFEKGIRFLNPVKARFIIKLTWRTHQTTTHEITIQHPPIETKSASHTHTASTRHAVVEPPMTSQQFELLKRIATNPFDPQVYEQPDDVLFLEDDGYILKFECLGEKTKGRYQRHPGWVLTEQGHNLIDQFG